LFESYASRVNLPVLWSYEGSTRPCAAVPGVGPHADARHDTSIAPKAAGHVRL